MKLKVLMSVTLVLLAVLFLLPPLGNRFYRPELSGLPHAWTERDFDAYGDDATLLRGTIAEPRGTSPDEPTNGAVVLLADSNLDRDWTARGRGLPAGRILARRLAGMGYRTVRFDQRGTGATIQSGRNYASPKNLAGDAGRVVARALSEADREGVILLAHGDACAAALRALNDGLIKARSALLVGCSLHGNLLEQWLGRILANMRGAGVPADDVAWAKKRMDAWREQREFATELNPTDSPSPDRQALERALAEMSSERLIGFTLEAEAFDFGRERDALLNAGDTRVFHLLGQRDLVVLSVERTAARVKANELSKRHARRYTFAELPDTDHFLAERTGDPSGALPLLIANLNPFRRIAPAFLETLDRVLPPQPERPRNTE